MLFVPRKYLREARATLATRKHSEA
jgi:hypothetical protein